MNTPVGKWRAGSPLFLALCADVSLNLDGPVEGTEPSNVAAEILYDGPRPQWVSVEPTDTPNFSFRLLHHASEDTLPTSPAPRWIVDLVANSAPNIVPSMRMEHMTICVPAGHFEEVCHTICQLILRQGYIGAETDEIFYCAGGKVGRAFFTPLTGEDAVIEFDNNMHDAWPKSDTPFYIVAQFEETGAGRGLENVTLLAGMMQDRAYRGNVIAKYFDACNVSGTLVVLFDPVVDELRRRLITSDTRSA